MKDLERSAAADTTAAALPTFLIVGAMKSGTTSLYEYLKAQPEVFLPPRKELDYFVEELNFGRGENWYRARFVGAEDARAIGEASTSYTKYPHYSQVPARIAKLLPTVKLVYVIRDPIDRIRSQYLHDRLLDEVRLPFEEAVRDDHRYVDISKYAMQMERYLEYFSRDQLLIVRAERLRDDQRATMTRVCSFLGVEPTGHLEVPDAEFHRTSEKRVPRSMIRRMVATGTYRRVSEYVPRSVKRYARRHMMCGVDGSEAVVSDALRKELVERLADDVVRLRAYLGDQFDGWGIA